MSYDFDHVPTRRGTGCEKWEKYDADVLPMWVADMDFASPEPVVRALRERVEHGFFGYPADEEGMDDLRQTIIDRLAERYQWMVEPEELFFLPGVITGFDLACHTLSAPRDGVLVQTPVYPPLWKAAKATGKTPQAMQLTCSPDGSYTIDWDAFEAAFSDQTGLFILCNPHNPVGRAFRRAELERMAQACLQRGVLICSDEIHSDLVFPGQSHIPIASLDPEIARHTITLMAPSKTFNLAGLQLSFAIIQDPTLRQRYRHSGQGLVPWVNLLARVAALAAYQEGGPWLEAMLAYLQANRDFLFDYVNTELPGITMAKPEATYLAWLDCRRLDLQGSPYDFFLKEARVALNDGALFNTGGEGFVRLNFGCPRSMLVEALERMKRALQGIGLKEF